MGKPKQTVERVKGNAKPLSSSRAAELLGSKGFSAGAPVGLTFSSFSSNVSSNSNSASESPSSETWSNLPGELVVILKKLAKRHSTTKIKALEELQNYLNGPALKELLTFLPIWTGFYNRLSGDLERKVRLIAQQILGYLLVSAGKQATPHLKNVMGAWSLSFFDPSKDVSDAATKSFNELFAPEKQVNAFKFTQSDILSHITTNLIIQTRESYSDARFYSEEEIEQRYIRLISCSLQALGMLIERLPEKARLDLSKDYHELLDNPKISGFFSHNVPAIRRAAYCLMTGLVLHDPDFVRSRFSSFASSFLNKALQEKDLSCSTASLDALVLSTKEFPELWLATKKPSFPKFLQYSDFIVNHKDIQFQKKFTPILPILIMHFPIELLNSDNITSLLQKITSIHQSDTTKWQDLSSWVAAAIEVYVSLADRLTKTDSPDSSSLTTLLTEDSIHLVSRFLFEIPCITIDNASTLLLKVVSFLWVTSQEEKVDNYLKEIELLLTDPLLEQTGSDSNESVDNLNRGVDLLANLVFQPRKFFGANGLQIQSKIQSLLDEFINISLEKLEAEQSLPGTVTFSSSSCFSLICLISQNLYINLNQQLQERIVKFLLQKFIGLLPKFNVSQGLTTIEIMLSHPNIPSTFASTIFEQLSQFAALPTDQLPYLTKLDFINFLCDKSLSYPSEVTLSSAIQDWILSVVRNLIISPEVSNSTESSKRLERLISFVLTAPEKLFSPGFHSYMLDNLNQAVNRYINKTSTYQQNVSGSSTETHDDILFKRLESLVQLISRAVESMLRHPSCEEGLIRLVKSHVSLLAYLFNISQNNIFSLWMQHLPNSSPENVNAIVHAFFNDIKLRVLKSSSFDDTRELAAKVSDIINCLIKSEWTDSELGQLVSSVCIEDSVWAMLRLKIIEKHHIPVQTLALTAFGGWISFTLSHTELDDLHDDMLAMCICFTSTVIKSLKKISSATCQMAAQYFATEVLFSWLESVLYGATQDLSFYLELDGSAWEILDLLNLTWDLSLEPYTPIIVTHLEAILDGVPGLRYLAIQLLWNRGINKCVPSESWQSWSLITASKCPELGHILLRGLTFSSVTFAIHFTSINQFRDELISEICLASPSDVLSAWESTNPFDDKIFCSIFFLYSLLGLPMSSYLCLDLHYWALSILENVLPSRKNDNINFWGILFPILNFTLLNSHQHSLNPISSKLSTDSDVKTQNYKTHGYDLLINTIHQLLNSDSTPEGYFLRSNALVLSEALIGLGIFCPDASGRLPENQSRVGKLYLKLFMDEQIENDPTYINRYAYLKHLGECASLYSNHVTLVDPPSFTQLCMLLHSPHPVISRSATQLIHHILPDFIHKIEHEIKKENHVSPRLPLSLLALTQEKRQHADENLIFNQLLAWLVIIYVFELSSYELKGLYVAQLENSGGIQTLMEVLLDVLVINLAPFDCNNWEITSIAIDGLDATSYPGIPLLASHIYFKLLKNLPSLIRAWWNECSNRNTISSLESFTEKYFSNQLVAATMKQVRDPDLRDKICDEQFSFKIGRSEVTATYELDENVISMIFRLPSSYPLKQAEVEGLKHAGVPERQWRSWLLGSTSVLVSQNGTLIDAMEQFKRNAMSHFDGQVDCMICYSMVSVLDRTLPNRTCRTCRNKFHAACLYKWIQSSSQSTCPLCRNLF